MFSAFGLAKGSRTHRSAPEYPLGLPDPSWGLLNRLGATHGSAWRQLQSLAVEVAGCGLAAGESAEGMREGHEMEDAAVRAPCQALQMLQDFQGEENLVELRGFEPLTSAVRLQRSPI